MSASLGRAIERVAAGEEPGCTLSRRASARLEEIRGRLAFVDGSSMPVVRDAAGRTTVWTFAGDRANAMLASSLRLAGPPSDGDLGQAAREVPREALSRERASNRAETDPVVRSAMELFRAELTEVTEEEERP